MRPPLSLTVLLVVFSAFAADTLPAGKDATTGDRRAANTCSAFTPAIDPSPADEFTRLVEIDSGDATNLDTRTPLILIHGIGGNKPEFAADDYVDDVCNPNFEYWRDLAGFLKQAPTVTTRYKIYSFHYVSNRFSVREIARALRNDLDQKIREDRQAGATNRFDKSIVIVAHSMGGLVARNYMNYFSHTIGRWAGQLGGERVQVLVTLGTPHHGSPPACSESRDELASSTAWRRSLDGVSLLYWATRKLGPIPVDWLSHDQHNRKDLRWDNFDGRVNANNNDINGDLATLNREERYASKLVAYYGYLDPDSSARNTLISVSGASDASPSNLINLNPLPGSVSYLDIYYEAKDLRMILLSMSVAMDLGLRRFYRENDGLVPRSSGSFEGVQVLKRVACVGHDHADMRDGSPRRCANGLTLFESLATELGIAAPPVGRITAAGVVNSASFRQGPLAPGEIVTVFGSGIGGASLRSIQVGADGRASTVLAGTSLMFDGIAAPLLYVSQNQLSAIVPYSVAGRTSTQILVDYQGRRSNSISIPIAASAPGIFTADSSGRGQAAALNQDGTLNSPSRPSQAGQVLVLYVTGEGQTTPAGQDGALAQTVFPKPRLPVTTRIGGLPADLLYAGAAPGLVAGVMQINVRIPAGVASGDVPVVVTVGASTSQSGVTVATRNSGNSQPDTSGITATWDTSEYDSPFRAVRRTYFRQDGTSLSGDSQDIFVNNTSRRGGGTRAGTNHNGAVNYTFRARTPDSETANATVDASGTVSTDGDSLSGTVVTYFDSGGSSSGVWNGTRRRLRASAFTFDGAIRHAGEQVHLAVWVPRGTNVTAEIFGERIGSGIDPVLAILRADAETPITSDDDTLGLDPKVSFGASQAPGDSQVYHIRISGYGESIGAFRLAVSLDPSVGQILPWQANLVSVPLTVNGVIGLRNEVDVYAVELPEAAAFVAEVTAERAGSALDAVLTVLGPDGITELVISDDEPGLGRDSRATFTTRLAGRHFVVVQSYDGSGGSGHTYALTLRQSSSGNTAMADRLAARSESELSAAKSTGTEP